MMKVAEDDSETTTAGDMEADAESCETMGKSTPPTSKLALNSIHLFFQFHLCDNSKLSESSFLRELGNWTA